MNINSSLRGLTRVKEEKRENMVNQRYQTFPPLLSSQTAKSARKVLVAHKYKYICRWRKQKLVGMGVWGLIFPFPNQNTLHFEDIIFASSDLDPNNNNNPREQ